MSPAQRTSALGAAVLARGLPPRLGSCAGTGDRSEGLGDGESSAPRTPRLTDCSVSLSVK